VAIPTLIDSTYRPAGLKPMGEMVNIHVDVEVEQYDQAGLSHVAHWLYEKVEPGMIERKARADRDRAREGCRIESEPLCLFRSISSKASHPGTNE